MILEQGPYGQANCHCLEGYIGDGLTCEVIPTHVIFQGFTLQDEILINPSLYPEVVTSVQDIGPIIEHNYEITNLGPQTVGNVEIKVFWPIKDAEGRDLTYLHETPKITIDMDGTPFVKDCVMDNPAIINPKRLLVKSR